MTDLRPITEHLSARAVHPAQRYILLKDVCGQHPDHPDCAHAYHQTTQSKWYRQLAVEQWDNGSWGRFHTQDTKAAPKQRFVTTESALGRARELGLRKDDPMVARCVALMERYMRGEEQWLDATEKHNDGGRSWPIAFRTLIAANIAMLDAGNPLIRHKTDACISHLDAAASGGTFDEDAWERANRSDDEILLKASTVYILWLLQHAPNMDAALQRVYLDYIWHRPQGIYYVSNTAPSVTFALEDKGFTMWLSALEALSGFSLFPEYMARGALPHLLREARRLMNGGVALPAPAPVTGRYAENWRDKDMRGVDMLLRIARVLAKC